MSTEQQPTLRQREILDILVREYVASAAPVGSGTLRALGRLRVSTATIRNELVALEELGFVSQPHTSAGRVPTIRGYRYFVEQLMADTDLPVPEQRTIHHQFHQLRLDLDQWMELTAAVLAHTVRSAALVTPPRATSSRFRHVELISVSERMFLLVLVLQDGSIHQEMLTTRHVLSQSELSQTSNKLNALFHDRSEGEISALQDPELQRLAEWEGEVIQRVMRLMRLVDEESVSRIYSDGLVNVLEQPEFVEADKFRRIVEVMEHGNLLRSILANILKANGVQVIIGGEGDYPEFDDVSLVLTPYGIRGLASGVLGVMGPTRLPYARAVSTVRYVAQVMNSMVADLYGQPDPEGGADRLERRKERE